MFKPIKNLNKQFNRVSNKEHNTLKSNYVYISNPLNVKVYNETIDMLNGTGTLSVKYKENIEQNVNDFLNGKNIRFWQGTANEHAHIILNLIGVPVITQEKDKYFISKIVKHSDEYVNEKQEIDSLPEDMEKLEIGRYNTLINIVTDNNDIELKQVNRFVAGDIMYEMSVVNKMKRNHEYQKLYNNVKNQIDKSNLPDKNKKDINKSLEKNIIISTKIDELEK